MLGYIRRFIIYKKFIFLAIFIFLLGFVYYFVQINIKEKLFLNQIKYYNGGILSSYFNLSKKPDLEKLKEDSLIDKYYILLYEELKNCKYDQEKFNFLENNFFRVNFQIDYFGHLNTIREIYKNALYLKIFLPQRDTKKLVEFAKSLKIEKRNKYQYNVLIKYFVETITKASIMGDKELINFNFIKKPEIRELIEIMQILRKKIDYDKEQLIKKIEEVETENVFLKEIKSLLICYILKGNSCIFYS